MRIYPMLLSVCFLLTGFDSKSQNYLMGGPAVNSCAGFFLDSGGGNNNYAPNENFIATVCPDGSTGTHTRLYFPPVDLRTGDQLCFYDANTADPARLLSCADDFEFGDPFIIQATAANSSGCITITFVSNASQQGSGWNARIECVPSCQSIQAEIVSSAPAAMPADTGWIDLCPNQAVSFSGRGIYRQNGLAYTQSDMTSKFEWDFGDGTHALGQDASHIYEKSGGYMVQLTVIDPFGCRSTNLIQKRVRVATTPTFQTGAAGAPEICVGDTIGLNAILGTLDPSKNYSAIGNEGSFENGGVRSDSLALPDGTGSAYETPIFITGFAPGQLLTDVNDLWSICVNMEHSWMRDMTISIMCPNGTEVIMHDHPGNIGGMVLLGEPVDFDGTRPTPGVGYDYCWTPDATAGTWLEYANSTFGTFGSGTLPSGDYSSYQPLSNLIGCPLNGEWMIRVQDLWAQDNGFIFSWSINFDPDLYPFLETFTPELVDGGWLPNPSILFQTRDTLVARPANAGNGVFTYFIRDEFGCTWDTSLTVNILPETHPNCHNCNSILEPETDTVICSRVPVQLDVTPDVDLITPITFESFPGEPVGFANYPPANPFESILGVNSIRPEILSNPGQQILSVCLDIDTDFASDLQLYLEAPNGQRLELSTNNGGSGGYKNTCFVPAAPTSIRSANVPFTGNFQPEGNWNALVNTPINGDWKLLVSDAAGAAQFGNLNNWSITFRNQNTLNYSWTNPGLLSCANCPNPVANVNSTSSFQVQVTDSYNCISTDSIEIELFNPVTPALDCGPSGNGQLFFLWQNVPGAGGYEISLNGGSWFPHSGSMFSTGNMVPGQYATLAIRSFYPNVNCFSEVDTIACRYVACDMETTADAEDSPCFGLSGGRVTLRPRNGLPPYQYALDGSTFQFDSLFTNLSVGQHTAVITDGLNCFDTVTFVINQPPPIVLDFTVLEHVKCFGGNNGIARVTPTGGADPYTFQWDDPLGQTTATANQLSAGIYFVTIEDAKGCPADGSVVINEPQEISIILNNRDVECRGDSTGSIEANVSGGTIPYGYLWNDYNNQTTVTARNLPIGTYTVTVTDVNGCIGTAFSTLNEPSTVVTASASQTLRGCFGSGKSEANVLAAGGTGTNYIYYWQNNQQTPTVSNLQPGQYTVTVTDENGCQASDTVVISELDSIFINIVASPPTCHGDSDGALGITIVDGGAGAGYQFRWSTGETSGFIQNLEGDKIYTVTVSDFQGCSNTRSILLPQPRAVLIDLDSIPTQCFNGSDGAATVANIISDNPIVAYQWGASAGNQNTPTATNLSAGNYSITVTDDTGCESVASVNVTQPSEIEIDFVIKNNDCFGDNKGSVRATASGGTPLPNGLYEYAWSNNQSIREITSLIAGNYTIIVTDGNGCEIAETVNVTQPTPIEADITAENVSCAGDRDGRLTIDASGGFPPYQFSTDGNIFSGNKTLIGLKAGEYDVLIKDAKGCIVVEKAEISEPAPFEVDAGPDFIEIELGETVQLNASSQNGLGLVQYLWSTQLAGALSCEICENTSVTPDNAMFINLYGQDENGCEDEDRVEIRVLKNRTVLVPTGFTPNGDGANDLLTVHGEEGTTIQLFQIYNRWGELLFEARDFSINDPLTGWDGNFRNEAQNSGVYMWYLEVEFIDGAKENLRGQTTLLR